MIHAKTGPWIFRGQCANTFYHEMLSTIRLEGEASAPRGLKTTELLHCLTRIDQPQKRVLTVPGRKLNPFFNLAEALWILEGKSEAWWILYFNSQLRKYLDPPLTNFHGAYGERLRQWPKVRRLSHMTGQDVQPLDQLMDCYWILHDDPESRQAAMILRSPSVDNGMVRTLDRPCNIGVTFKLRRNLLYMSVFNRSNDMILGLTSTNIVQFSTLQETLASWLDVGVGPYTHYSDSLHIYDTQDTTDQLHAFNVYDYVAPMRMLPMLPVESDAMRHQLYDALGALIKNDHGVVSNLQDTFFTLACEYWDSVKCALYAYVAHRTLKDWRLALTYLSMMETPDWQIECLRFLADRYTTEQDFPGMATKIITDLKVQGGLQAVQAIWRYVFQSSPDDALLSFLPR